MKRNSIKPIEGSDKKEENNLSDDIFNSNKFKKVKDNK